MPDIEDVLGILGGGSSSGGLDQKQVGLEGDRLGALSQAAVAG